jgi:hypothetical protein
MVVALAALVLASCTSGVKGAAGEHSNGAITPNAFVSPTSMCSSSNGFLTQANNGDISGCFRVPNLRSSSMVVALQTYLINSSKSRPTTTTTTPPVVEGRITLTLKPRVARPGEKVEVTGTFAGPPPTQHVTFGYVCWDGCQTGPVEQGQSVRWSSARTFHTSLVVPDTAWLESGADGVVVHPLVSGSYEVGVECLGNISGCALKAAQAQTTLQLNASTPTRCVTGKRCETLHLSATTAPIGEEVNFDGWAPLQTLGQPFGYYLSIAPAKPGRRYATLSYTRLSKTGGYNVVLAPSILHVGKNVSWASLGRLSYMSSTRAGPSTIDPVTNSTLTAWCQPDGLFVTGVATPRSVVQTSSVSEALKGTDLALFADPLTHPPCSSVLIDPYNPHTIFASFGAAQDNEAPPVYLAPLYTTDNGALWQRVPAPPGTTLEDFGGFTSNGADVEALFASQASFGNDGFPKSPIEVESTSNGGLSWTASTLGCPSLGPCAVFGPDQWGNCAMNGSFEPLMVGPSSTKPSAGVRWSKSLWVTSVNSCFSQQLAVTSSRGLILLDPSSQYPMLRSNDSGTSWFYVALPAIPWSNPTNGLQLGDSLLFAPDGSLFASLTTPSGQRQELFRLMPGATSWCQVPHVFPANENVGTVSALQVSQTDLLWSETSYVAHPNLAPSVHEVALSTLRC